ncbi:GNAT family N-acetyltransferase [Enterococcus saccharolyticus]|uniref:GNAT family N-acetyltransferase n=1 Tax=Enterococcus saccharolyticus TaxID=41997 RepID=UPI0039E164E3
MSLRLEKCTVNDLKTLQEISFETFNDTFAKQNSPENMNAYLDNAYTDEKLTTELQTPHSTFFFLYKDDELAGYLKVNTDEAQTEAIAVNALEIERIYIRSTHKRQGLGRYLIDQACNLAVKKGKETIWLGVWEHNQPARAFYQTMGFVRQGQHSFFMGDDEQTDFIMVKNVHS